MRVQLWIDYAILLITSAVFEFNEFEPRLNMAKTGLNLEEFNTILSGSWNQPYLSRGLNLSRGSHSLNLVSELKLSEEILWPYIFQNVKHKQKLIYVHQRNKSHCVG